MSKAPYLPNSRKDGGYSNSAIAAQVGETVLGGSTTWQQLTTSNIRCSGVLLTAPTAAHPNGAANTGNVYYLIASAQPASTGGAAVVTPTMTTFFLPVGDASQVWIYGTAADALEWQALQA